jgi:hypothetical protein
MPLEWRVSKGGLEQNKKAAAVLCSRDKQPERIRFVAYP